MYLVHGCEVQLGLEIEFDEVMKLQILVIDFGSWFLAALWVMIILKIS